MYQALYRCRLCGKEFHEEDTYKGECEAIASRNVPKGMYGIHHCLNGNLGNADFKGFEWRIEGDDELEGMFIPFGIVGFKCNKCGKLHVYDHDTTFENKDRMHPCIRDCGGFVIATYANAVKVDEYGREVKNAE